MGGAKFSKASRPEQAMRALLACADAEGHGSHSPTEPAPDWVCEPSYVVPGRNCAYRASICGIIDQYGGGRADKCLSILEPIVILIDLTVGSSRRSSRTDESRLPICPRWWVFRKRPASYGSRDSSTKDLSTDFGPSSIQRNLCWITLYSW